MFFELSMIPRPQMRGHDGVMTTQQHPIGTGFTAASTTADVLEGVDLAGRTAIVTGGNAGLGLATARALLQAGAQVTVASRNLERARRALDEAGLVAADVAALDLTDPTSIDAFVAGFLAHRQPLHILVNNAGLGLRERTLDPRGHELVFSTSHLGHFRLTRGLLPALQAARGARVVTVTSGAHRLSDIRWDDLDLATGFDPTLAYGQAKTANILFTVELDRRYAREGIRAFAAHPGIAVATSLAHLDTALYSLPELRAQGLIDEHDRPIIDPEREQKSVEQAAATIVFGAASPLLDGLGGLYLKNSEVAPIDDSAEAFAMVGGRPVVRTDVAPHAIDPASARRLWRVSERLAG